MGKPRIFTTLPVRAIADTRLSALDLRVLMVVSLHDGMSSVKGNGAGCYAKLATLAALAKTDVTNLSKSANRLAKFDYLTREAQKADKRRFTLRVIFGEDDSWRDDQQSSPDQVGEKVGETTNQCAEIVGQSAYNDAEIVGDGDHENGSFSSGNDEHYTPQRGELDSAEAGELDSVQTAQHALRAARGPEDASTDYQNSASSDPAQISAKIIPLHRARDRAEARLGSEVSIISRLTPHFNKLSPEAQLTRFEEELRLINRRFDRLPSREQQLWRDWLFEFEDYLDIKVRGHSQRLIEELLFETEEVAQ